MYSQEEAELIEGRVDTMSEKKEVYRYVKLNDNVKAISLSTLDKLRLLLSKIGNDAAKELDASEKISAEHLKQQAALSLFLDKAIENMESRGESSVTVKISSDFKPYLNDVIDPISGKGRYYSFSVSKDDKALVIKHNIYIRIFKKKVNGIDGS